MVNVKDNISYIREILYVLAKRFDRDVDEIKLVCVTKEASLEQLNEALSAGISNFGENRIQDAKRKIISINKPIRWHMIGHLQSNKVKEAVKLFDLIQSVDSIELADAIELEAQRQNRTVDVLVEVNTSGEASKFGATIKELPGLILHTAALRHINIMGLMTIAPWTDDPEASRPYFKSLRELREKIKEICPDNVTMDILSMGMSSDFEVAIEEGSNMIRIGSLIFKSDTERVKERLRCISRN